MQAAQPLTDVVQGKLCYLQSLVRRSVTVVGRQSRYCARLMPCSAGAFTPGCSVRHLPGFISALKDIKAKGVDIVAVIAFNDGRWSFVHEFARNSQQKIAPIPSAAVPRSCGFALPGSSSRNSVLFGPISLD